MMNWQEIWLTFQASIFAILAQILRTLWVADGYYLENYGGSDFIQIYIMSSLGGLILSCYF